MNHLDRRAFLRAAGAHIALGAAGAALTQQVRASTAGTATAAHPRTAPTAGATTINLAVKIGMIAAGDTLEEKFAAAKAAGFAGVELDSPGPHAPAAANAAGRNTGIDIHGVVLSTHWQQPFNHPDAAVREKAQHALETAIRDCADVGGSTVLVVPAVVNQTMPYADAYSRSQDAMHRAADLADKNNVSIAFENVWNNFLLSPLEAARYVDELNANRDRRTFGWYFDIGNIVNFGWPEQWIDTLGDRILKLDVKEFSRKRRDDEGLWKGFGVEIGEGDVGWDRVRAALARINYTGWATAEVAGGGPERLADIATRMHRVLNPQ